MDRSSRFSLFFESFERNYGLAARLSARVFRFVETFKVLKVFLFSLRAAAAAEI